MNTDIHFKSSNQLPEAAREIVKQATVATQNASGVVEDLVKETYQTMLSNLDGDVVRTKGYAQQVTDAIRDTANRATDVAKDIYQSAALKTGDALATSKEYVRRNPVPVVIGAIAFGAALGYLLVMARRKQTFGERYVDEPLVAVREAILGVLAPVALRVHEGYDSARDGAEKAMDRVQSFVPGRNCGSLSHQIGRIGNNLKFW